MKKLNFLESLKFSQYVLLISLFLCNFLFSQQADPQSQISPATIVLKSGAKIFSTDENFNKQVLNEKNILKNSDLSYQENGDKESLLNVTSKPLKEEKKDLKNQLKTVEEKKERETLKKLKKEIDQHKERSKSFLQKKLNSIPSSEEFIASTHINQEYVAPSYRNHDFSNICFTENTVYLQTALDFLHSQKYTYYNNKSINHCFSEVFSVRPPPVLV